MGGVLEKPITTKESGWGPPSGPLGLAWASSCMQGWRVGMEDAHICLPSVHTEGHWRDVAMFGVMDGHGGEQVAKFAERHLPEEVRAYPSNRSLSNADLEAALTTAFHRIDDLLRTKEGVDELWELTNTKKAAGGFGMGAQQPQPELIGCTSCVCYITPTHIVVANAGDSRAVLCRGGVAIALSEDHKPNNAGETKRIVAAGGYVETQHAGTGTQYRVNGNLNLSRALGDLEYKKDRSRGPEAQIISATPDVEFFQRTPDDEFVIICCDGVWDVKTNQQVVDFVRRRLNSGSAETSPVQMARAMDDLLDDCVSPDLRQTKGLGGDNMTAVVVRMPKPDVAVRGSRAQASSAQRRPQLVTATASVRSTSDTGELKVSVALSDSMQWTARDVDCWVSEATSEFEVALMPQYGHTEEGSTTSRIDLREHLPPGWEMGPVVNGYSVRLSRSFRVVVAGVASAVVMTLWWHGGVHGMNQATLT